MIQIVQGFKLLTRDPVDWRLSLTKEQMRTINDNQMPDKYFAICKDDGLLYRYDKNRVVPATLDDKSENTGKFVPYSTNKIESVTINGVIIPIDDKGNLEIPLGSKDEFGVVKSGYGLRANDGIISVDFNAMEDNSIPFNKIDFGDELILDGNE